MPDPLPPEVIVTHEAFDEAVHELGEQPDGLADTVTCPLPPLAPTLLAEGEIVNVHGVGVELAAAWVTVTVRPATVMLAERLEPVLAETV